MAKDKSFTHVFNIGFRETVLFLLFHGEKHKTFKGHGPMVVLQGGRGLNKTFTEIVEKRHAVGIQHDLVWMDIEKANVMLVTPL